MFERPLPKKGHKVDSERPFKEVYWPWLLLYKGPKNNLHRGFVRFRRWGRWGLGFTDWVLGFRDHGLGVYGLRSGDVERRNLVCK